MRVRIVVLTVLVAAFAAVPSIATAQATTSTQKEMQVYPPGNGVTWPKVVKEVKPTYPRDVDRDAKAMVELEVFIADDGTVSSAVVTKSAGKSFDEAAIEAAKKWVFTPATKESKAVATKVGLVLEFKPEPYTPGNGVTWPKVKQEVKPEYPANVAEKLQGAVELEVVVAADGTVSSARITRSLDNGKEIDQSAIATAKKWLFEPGMKDGKPVPTKVGMVLEFRHK